MERGGQSCQRPIVRSNLSLTESVWLRWCLQFAPGKFQQPFEPARIRRAQVAGCNFLGPGLSPKWFLALSRSHSPDDVWGQNLGEWAWGGRHPRARRVGPASGLWQVGGNISASGTQHKMEPGMAETGGVNQELETHWPECFQWKLTPDPQPGAQAGWFYDGKRGEFQMKVDFDPV